MNNNIIKNIKINKKVNLGLEILRMLMSFWVIMTHYYQPKYKVVFNMIILHAFHVPTFFIMSFYFLFPNLSKRNLDKIKNRLERLIIPYIIYPVLYCIINNLLYILNKDKIKIIKFKYLLMQLLIGRRFFNVLWFHFNLILLTISFYIISFLFKGNYLIILQIFGLITYVISISNLNFDFFSEYRDEIKLSVGHFAETIPLSITGLTLASFDIIYKVKNYRNKAIFFSLSLLIMLFKYDIFTEVKGFGKQGLLNIIAGSLFFILFSLFPLDDCNKNVKKIIRYMTYFTPGIYFLHTKIFHIFKIIDLIKNLTFLGCIIIYILSYLICIIFYLLFKHTKMKYLFI